jgi:hypothetical protein
MMTQMMPLSASGKKAKGISRYGVDGQRLVGVPLVHDLPSKSGMRGSIGCLCLTATKLAMRLLDG